MPPPEPGKVNRLNLALAAALPAGLALLGAGATATHESEFGFLAGLAVAAGLVLAAAGLWTTPLGLGALGLRRLADALELAATPLALSCAAAGAAAAWRVWPASESIGERIWLLLGAAALSGSASFSLYIRSRLRGQRRVFGETALRPELIRARPGEEAALELDTERPIVSAEARLELYSDEDDRPLRTIPGAVSSRQAGSSRWTHRASATLPADAVPPAGGGWVLIVELRGQGKARLEESVEVELAS